MHAKMFGRADTSSVESDYYGGKELNKDSEKVQIKQNIDGLIDCLFSSFVHSCNQS